LIVFKNVKSPISMNIPLICLLYLFYWN